MPSAKANAPIAHSKFIKRLEGKLGRTLTKQKLGPKPRDDQV
jgi:hypothetical protein